MIKQTHDGLYPSIQTDGCYFMADLSIADERRSSTKGTYKEMTMAEINKAWHYAIPDFMEDHRITGKSRCYILKHEDIIAIGLRIMGFREFEISYKYRKDGDRFIIGDERSLMGCNYFIKEVPYKNASHFLRCDLQGKALYNSGNTDNNKWLSFRGIYVLTGE